MKRLIVLLLFLSSPTLFAQSDIVWMQQGRSFVKLKYDLAFSPDGKSLAVGGENEIKLWEVSAGELVQVFKHNNYIRLVTFSRDGKLIISGSDYH